MNARRDVGELLAAQLEAIDPSDLIRQRDSARAWAAEYMRRVDAAALAVTDMDCDCASVGPPDGPPKWWRTCAKHILEPILAGDQ